MSPAETAPESPPHGTLFALNMLVATEAGDTYTASEVSTWMRDAGLAAVECRDTPFGTGLVIGRRPAAGPPSS